MQYRLTLVIHSLAMGGVERVAATMANHWASEGVPVTVVTLDTEDSDTYPLAQQVTRVALGLMGDSRNVLDAVRKNVRRISRLREAIRESKPDVVMSLSDKTNVLTLLACRRLPVPVIVAEHMDPRQHRIGPIWSTLRRLTYPSCAALVVLTEGVRQYVRRFVGNRPVFVIPNPAHSAANTGDLPGNSAQQLPRLVAMGRLAPVKGFDLLIEAFSRLVKHAGWCLHILGEGPQREELAKLIRQKGLEGRIELLGWVAEPAAVLRSAELFVLSSRYEAFPNALLEAMACGLPVVSFDCQSGPAEIIRHGIDGLLVPPGNVEELAKAIDHLLSRPEERRRLGLRAAEVVERFSTQKFFENWEHVLRSVLPD